MAGRRSKKAVKYNEDSENDDIKEIAEEEVEEVEEVRTQTRPSRTSVAKGRSNVNWRPFLQNPMPDNWPGWLTVESDPAVFNQLVRDFGVEGLQIEEIYAIDPELFASLPTIHGLILLFKYNDGNDEEAEDVEDTPENLWFANQEIHATNACASYALMNIILNIPENTPGIDIGENLRMFRAHSIEMTPPNRGLDLAGFEFVRTAHNRFGKRLETCHEDISMEQKYEASQKKNKRKSTKGKSTSNEQSDVYHFIAYVPFEGNVYELDGLKRSPSVVGVVKEHESWADVVIPLLLERFQDHEEDGIETNLLAVCSDKANFLRAQVEALSELLKKLESSDSQSNGSNDLPSIHERFSHLSTQFSFINKLADAQPDTLDNIKQEITSQIERLSRDVAEERGKMDGYVEYSTRRRHNYMPFISEYLTMLIRKKYVEVEPKGQGPKGRRKKN